MPITRADADTKRSEQSVLVNSYDETYRTLITQDFETPKAIKVTVSGSITYIADAPVGSLQADPVWRVKKVDETDGTVVTWADSGNYSQVATDLTALEYA